MPVVYDASVVAAWRLRDEQNSAAATTVAIQLTTERGIVPGNFWYEIRNVLVRAERQGRIHQDGTDRFIERLDALVEPDLNHNEAATIELARRHGLSFYDAAYLETALRRQADLATFDRALAAAVRAEGIRNPAEEALGEEV